MLSLEQLNFPWSQRFSFAEERGERREERGERREEREERGENTSGSGRCEYHYHATIAVKSLPEVPEVLSLTVFVNCY